MLRSAFMVLTATAIIMLNGALPAHAATLPRVAVSATDLTVNGATFSPRGVNYVRLDNDGSRHSTFEPGQYDKLRAQAMLQKLRADGYNTVRVFIHQGNFSGEEGVGGSTAQTVPFRADYMANVADFIQMASGNGIYTVPVLSLIPTNCYFYAFMCHGGNPRPNLEGFNTFYMDPSFVAAKAEYLRLFAADMLARLGTTSGILAYEADNEANFETNQAPFKTRTGTVQGLDDVTYSMASTSQRQAVADKSFALYAVRIKAGLRQGDPDAKLMIGVFTNFAVGKTGFDGFAFCSGPAPCKPHTDYRYPARIKVATAVDLADLHQYSRNSSSGYTVAGDLATIEKSSITVPFVIGEFGAFKDFFPTVTEAAYAMRDAQIQACRTGAKGGGFFWTYDTTGAESDEMARMYTLMQNDGAINGQLAPVARPNPCTTP